MATPPHTDAPFAARHLGPNADEVTTMLATLGVASMDELLDAVVPDSIRDRALLDLPNARTEAEALEAIAALAASNRVVTSMIGMGYTATRVPGVIQRNILENPAWYTAYTPYQPEISQGRLEALVNFQTLITDLTGLDLANASMLDEGTAAAEAMTMARRAVRSASKRFFVDSGVHPQTLAVIATRAEPVGIELVVGDPAVDLDATDVFGAVLALPTSTGAVVDPRPAIDALRSAGAFSIVVADLLGLCLIEAPGAWGVDAVVGSAQRFGVPVGFGGPHAGLLATADRHRRAMPGRLVGVSRDAAGRPAYRLALQTREQHIRREKATSNICTAQVLLAVMASMYAVYHGPDGLRGIAARVHGHAGALAAALEALGVGLAHDTWFDTVTARVAGRGEAVVAAALDLGINLRGVDADHVGITCDETTTVRQLTDVVAAFGSVLGSDGDSLAEAARLLGSPGSNAAAARALPNGLVRRTPFLEHPTFHRYRSETEMLRYLRRLADADLALDRSMIPLGSCTMKLNATSEMVPISWPAFADIHPFAPADQGIGYRQLIADLETWLARVTGYDAVSLQPNAGSQGELAGLLAIRAYHRARGDVARTTCLIPASAHGTNAASAVMAGLDVVVVACDDDGNVDVDDLAARIDAHRSTLAALMVTYPSTHGVFEEAIVEICAMVHEAGGQLYLDGANMNALVGLARPGAFGADVSHLNLHKTFCIPHGGGGPGVGPVAVRSHLAPFLPNHPVVADAGPATGVGPVAAAPWGSASILPISWMYVAMMGPEGLRDATAHAILAANYVARRLGDAFPVLYSGRDGLVAHECILDVRPIERRTGIGAEDIAKRLIDYGFHAPTMSFPVAGTLMVEPTESESLAELDRFCDAMLAIREEIARVEAGEWAAEDSPLRHAPHPAADVSADEWERAYPRSLAAYPTPQVVQHKYWAPVSRIDGGYGDRNLVCTCPPITAFADASDT